MINIIITDAGREQRTYLRNSASSLLWDASISSRRSFMASSIDRDCLFASECETWLTRMARNNAALS